MQRNWLFDTSKCTINLVFGTLDADKGNICITDQHLVVWKPTMQSRFQKLLPTKGPGAPNLVCVWDTVG